MEQNQRVLYGEIVSRAWEDEAFKNRFLTSPEEVLKEAGITVEEGVEYKVIEAPKFVQYMVLPHEKQQEAAQEMVKILLARAEQAQPVVPEGMEIRIVQNTDSIRYLVFPASPKLLTSAELKMISGGGFIATSSIIVHKSSVVTFDPQPPPTDVTTQTVDVVVQASVQVNVQMTVTVAVAVVCVI